MVQNMKENGLITRLTVKENSIMLMEISMRANGKTIKQMDMENTLI